MKSLDFSPFGDDSATSWPCDYDEHIVDFTLKHKVLMYVGKKWYNPIFEVQQQRRKLRKIDKFYNKFYLERVKNYKRKKSKIKFNVDTAQH